MTRRLIATYLLLALVVLAMLEVPLGIAFRRSEQRDLTVRVERDAVALASIADDVLRMRAEEPGASAQPTRQALAELRTLASDYEAETGARVLIVDADGTAVVATAVEGAPPAIGRSFASRSEVRRALAGDVVSGTRESRTLGYHLLYVGVPASSGGVIHGAVRLTYPMSELTERVARYWLTLAVIAAIVLLAAAGVGIALARWAQRPLDTVRRAAIAVGGGDLTMRADVADGPPEIRELAHEFNSMVSRLAQLVDVQQAFVADASHQLRTPLTALRLQLESLQADTGGVNASIDASLREAERLSRLVDGLLALARADREPVATRVIALGPVVDARVASWRALAEDEQVELRSSMPDGIEARCAPEALEQVLDNLIDNALKASATGGAIEIAARSAGNGRVELHVRDEGVGMDADQLAHAFDRFWTSSRGRGGSGLGLAIARRLVEVNGGKLELVPNPPPARGIDAVITLDGR